MPEISRYCIPYTPFSGALAESRIGIVSTAGVHLRSQDPFVLAGDNTVRLIPADASSADLTASHEHYDTSDAERDADCVFPVEVLRELVSEGKIGSTTSEHLSMGFSQAMREIKEKIAPEIATTVRRWKPDAILLTAG
jgi:hypothetical protein